MTHRGVAAFTRRSERPKLGSEEAVLLLCTRSQPDPHEAQAALAATLDWSKLLNAVGEHGLTCSLHALLQGLPTNSASAGASEALAARCRANAIRALYLVAELVKILDSFQANGVSAFTYKGPALAAQIYADITQREFEDLDIVLRHLDVMAAAQQMVALGYAPEIPGLLTAEKVRSRAPGEYAFLHAGGRCRVELHTERTMRHFPKPLSLDSVFARLESVPINGRSVATLNVEDGLVFLAVHGAKDFWSRLQWVKDIGGLIARRRELDWDRTFQNARQWGAERMFKLALCLAQRLAGAALPPCVVASICNDRVVSGLAAEIKKQLLCGQPVLGAASRMALRLRLAETFAQGIRYSARLALSPDQEDLARQSPGNTFSAMPFILRPFRLLRKHGLTRSKVG